MAICSQYWKGALMIKGLDNGYAFTKDNERRIFKSAYDTVDRMITGSRKITIDGNDYYVGVGNMTCEVDKTNTEINKVCTIANLVSSRDTEFYLVVGLPIGQFKAQNDKFKEIVLSYNKLDIRVNGEQRKIHINDVMVFPQGAAAAYTFNWKSDCIIVDVGGLTIDVALIEKNYNGPGIVKSDTWYKGMRLLYTSIIEQVNLKYGLRLETREAEKILINGLKIRGESKDLTFLQPIYKQYITPIIEDLELNYPTSTTPMFLCGGGAQLLYNSFARKFSDVQLISDMQFANAVGYHEIGKKLYGRFERKVV